MPLHLMPKPGPEGDMLFNRRVLAYYGLIFSVYWNHIVLIAYVYLSVKGVGSDAALVALLGVPGTLAGLGFWKYLKAAEKEDEVKIIDRISNTYNTAGSIMDDRSSMERSAD